jgi:diguanylate cyclase (GGDEF)-like protein
MGAARDPAMQIDSYTVLLSGVFVKAILCALFLAFWLHDRRSIWFAWLGGTYFFGLLATVIFLQYGFRGDTYVIGAGVAAVIVSFGCCWQAARAFERRGPLLWPVAIVLGVWIAACLMPGFFENMRVRVVVSSILVAPMIAMAAFEFWRGRNERLLSRWPLIILFASLALVFASRIVLVDLLPFPFGALPLRPSSTAIFNLITFCHTLLLTVLFVALTRERLELEQRTKAQTDPLTGALNRGAFMARGARFLQRHSHEKAPLSLLFFDLDHFKALNDQFGHSGGDDVLMLFVGIVHDNTRPTDFLFRIGGEEFCCLLPHTGVEAAQNVAERIRQQFEAASICMPQTPATATVSVGVACTEDFGYDLDALVRRADMAVDAAKRQGRNRVIVARADDASASTPPIGAPAPAGAS